MTRPVPLARSARSWRLLALIPVLAVVAACHRGTAPAPRSPADPASHRSVSPGPASPSPAASRLPLLGAYYYSWYPENLAGGSLGSHLVPPAGPDPASEISADPATAERNIAEAASAGIDFFALDWWPNRPDLNQRIDTGFLHASNVSSVHFAVMYETQAIEPAVPYEVDTPMTPAAQAQLVADMVSIAKDYFANPQYLRIGGRPVVFWYLTRTLTGNVAGAVQAVRSALSALGYNVFLIGDEMFWRVTSASGATVTAPQPWRAKLFDAITWYNLYDASQPDLTGYASSSGYLPAINKLIASYKAALGGSVPIVPDVIPGYNDRATRPSENHPAIPREYARGEADGSLLAQMFDQVALPNVDPRAPVVMITSWNEWNEQTAIEPVSSTATTSRDDSRTGTEYTQGYPYGGPGDALLGVVRQLAYQRPPGAAASPGP